jgi:hypothetical protein
VRGAVPAVVWSASVAYACPVCSTATGEAVRAGIADGFLFNLLATLAPFPFLIAAVAGLHWGWPRRRVS